MTGRPPLTLRAAGGWVRLYTRNVPDPEGEERRDEVASDVFEHHQSARAAGRSERSVGWSIARRTLRGAPADVSWRVGRECVPGRLSWHLDHPATVLTLSLLALVPLGVAADVLRHDGQQWRSAGLIGLIVIVGYACTAAFALVAAARLPRRDGSGRPLSLRQVRGAWVCAMSFCWAMSGVWRFAPEPLHVVAALAWAGFGVAVLGYLGTLLAVGVRRGVRRRTRVGLDV